MKLFVLDASVALAWLIARPVAPYAVRIQHLLLSGSRALVPSVWPLEIASGFVTAERRGMLTHSDTVQLLQNLDVALQSVDVRLEAISMRRLIATARAARLTAYDAAYLDLARDQQLPIATLDRSLAQAANQAGIPLVQ